MLSKRMILFLLLSLVFTATHYFAVTASLYWYFWWFDILMHFWGGVLLGLGVHALTTLSFVKLEPTMKLLLVTLVIATFTWEIFEWFTGLYETTSYLLNTTKDIFMGFAGGLLAHLVLSKRTIRS